MTVSSQNVDIYIYISTFIYIHNTYMGVFIIFSLICVYMLMCLYYLHFYNKFIYIYIYIYLIDLIVTVSS